MSMKKITFISLFVISLIIGGICTSCSDDSDVTPDLYSVIATLCRAENGTWFFKDDDGTTLLLSPSINFREVYLGKRFYLEFSLVSRKKNTDYDLIVQLYHIEQVVVQSVLPISGQAQSDSVGHDPIDVYGMWASGTYINLMYGIYWEGHRAHLINLVQNLSAVKDSMFGGHPVVCLELRHNGFSEAELHNYFGIMSFDYSNLMPPFQGSDSVRFSVKYKDYMGEEKVTNIMTPVVSLPQENAPTQLFRASKRFH